MRPPEAKPLGRLRSIFFSATLLTLGACSGDDSQSSAGLNQAGADGPVTVSWTGNRETAVNAPGGGYRVYYSGVSGFSIASADFVDVPYVSGAGALTSASLNVGPGRYFVRVVAYSALSPEGSEPSAEAAVTVPLAALAEAGE